MEGDPVTKWWKESEGVFNCGSKIRRKKKQSIKEMRKEEKVRRQQVKYKSWSMKHH